MNIEYSKKYLSNLVAVCISIAGALLFIAIVSSIRCGQEYYALSDCKASISKVTDFRKTSKEKFCAADKENCYKVEMKLMDDVIKQCMNE